MKQVLFLFMTLCLFSCAKETVLVEQETEIRERRAKSQTDFLGNVSIFHDNEIGGWSHEISYLGTPPSISPVTNLSVVDMPNGNTRFLVAYDLWSAVPPVISYLIQSYEEGGSNTCYFSFNGCETIGENEKGWYIIEDEQYFVGYIEFEEEGLNCLLENNSSFVIPSKWVYD